MTVVVRKKIRQILSTSWFNRFHSALMDVSLPKTAPPSFKVASIEGFFLELLISNIVFINELSIIDINTRGGKEFSEVFLTTN